MEFLESEAALDALLTGFEDGTWPKAKWTHAAHLATGTCYILAYDDALDRLRTGIPRYNVSQGGQNTEESGYHETLTVFWHNVIRDFIATLTPNQRRLTIVRAVVTEFAPKRDIFRRYYDFDVVNSREARKKWIPPKQRSDTSCGTVLPSCLWQNSTQDAPEPVRLAYCGSHKNRRGKRHRMAQAGSHDR